MEEAGECRGRRGGRGGGGGGEGGVERTPSRRGGGGCQGRRQFGGCRFAVAVEEGEGGKEQEEGRVQFKLEHCVFKTLGGMHFSNY